jgi:hypothetical protein
VPTKEQLDNSLPCWTPQGNVLLRIMIWEMDYYLDEFLEHFDQ